MHRFKPVTRDMDSLFPPSMNDGLTEPHLARFIVEIADPLDLSLQGTGSTRTGAFGQDLTDAESRIMKVKGGGFEQCY